MEMEFNTAVMTLGITIENMLQEMVETGSGSQKKRVPRYSLSDLLSDQREGFAEAEGSAEDLAAMLGGYGRLSRNRDADWPPPLQGVD